MSIEVSMLKSTSWCTDIGEVLKDAYSVPDGEVTDSCAEKMGDHICAVAALKADESTELSREPSNRKESWMLSLLTETIGPYPYTLSSKGKLEAFRPVTP